jgi:uncharacterized protein YdaU (DUF1376 family)
MSDRERPAFLPWYKWFPREFSVSEEAAALTLAEEGAVRRLLDHQWTQGSIPANMEQLANLCRVSPKEMAKYWKRVERFFEPAEDPSRLRNADLQRQYETVVQGRKVLSAAGQRGAAARWRGHDVLIKEATTAPWPCKGFRKADADADADADAKHATRGLGMRVFAEVRKARVCTPSPSGPRYHLPADYLKGLDYATRAAIEGVGGPHVIAAAEDDKLPILRPQFADMYVSADADGRGAAEGCLADQQSVARTEVDERADDSR